MQLSRRVAAEARLLVQRAQHRIGILTLGGATASEKATSPPRPTRRALALRQEPERGSLLW
jgi:hypothetical protein